MEALDAGAVSNSWEMDKVRRVRALWASGKLRAAVAPVSDGGKALAMEGEGAASVGALRLPASEASKFQAGRQADGFMAAYAALTPGCRMSLAGGLACRKEKGAALDPKELASLAARLSERSVGLGRPARHALPTSLHRFEDGSCLAVTALVEAHADGALTMGSQASSASDHLGHRALVAALFSEPGSRSGGAGAAGEKAAAKAMAAFDAPEGPEMFHMFAGLVGWAYGLSLAPDLAVRMAAKRTQSSAQPSAKAPKRG